MENNCCNKKTKRSPDDKKLIINRLNRIGGQIKGITKMVENDAYCNDVLIQLSAVKNSVKSLSTHILENHLYMCVANDLENGELDTIDELISLFKRFNQ
jgi:DNA-binding FrmR family transcriptional regulator